MEIKPARVCGRRRRVSLLGHRVEMRDRNQKCRYQGEVEMCHTRAIYL